MSNSALHICIVTPNFAGGGAEKIGVGLANHYSKTGFKVTLISFTKEGPYLNQISPAVDVVDLGVPLARYAFWRLLRTLKCLKPDALLSVIRGSNIVIGLTRYIYSDYRCVYREANTMDGIKHIGLIGRIAMKILMRMTYSKADAVIANSEGTKDSLLAYGVVDEKKCIVIVNPVLPSNYEELSNDPLDHPWLTNKKYKTMLNIGRLHTQKNQAMLIRALSKVKNIIPTLRLVIVGEGEEKEALMKLAEELMVADRIEIINFQNNPFPFYRNSDIFVLTSNWEGFGNVLVEAMACGAYIICTDCPGGPRSILEDGKLGVLVDVDNSEMLGEAILERFSLNNKYENIESVGIIEKYGIESVAKQYMSVISRISIAV